MMNTNMRRILKTPTLRMQSGGDLAAANNAKLQAFSAANPDLGAVQVPAGAGRGSTNPEMANPAMTARPMPPPPAPVLRDGNSFGDAASLRPGGVGAVPQSNLQQYAADDVAARGAGMKATSGDWARTTPYAPPGVSPMPGAAKPVDQGAAMDQKVLASSAAAAQTPARERRGTEAPAWTPMAMPTVGMKDGGSLRTGQGGHVPGTGQGDKIDAKYEPGEFVVSNDMLDAEPGLREQLHGLRGQVLAAQGTTPQQADAKAVSGGTLRAQAGGGLFPYNQPEKDIYAGLGKPASAPENAPKPGVMLPPQQLQGAINGQNQRAVASTGPANSSSATGGWGDSAPGAGVAGVPGGAAGVAGARFMPNTRDGLSAVGNEVSAAWDQGKYAKVAGKLTTGTVAGVKNIADDVFGGFARGAYGLLRNPAEDFGRAAFGMEDRKPESAAPQAVPTPSAAVPAAPTLRDQQLAAQAVAPNTTGTQAPAPVKLGDTREIDEYAGTMQVYTKGPGGDKAGWTTVSTPAAKQARGLREQAYDQRMKDDYERATNGPNGWKTQEAARLRREEDSTPMGKHKRAALTARRGQEATLQAATLQNQTSRDNNAATNETTLRTQANSAANSAASAAAAKAEADRKYTLDAARFGVETANKTRDDKRAGEEAFSKRIHSLVGTDKEGKPDAAVASATLNSANTFLAEEQVRAEATLKADPNNKGAAAALEHIKKYGPAGIDETKLREIMLDQKARKVAKSGAGWTPWGGAAAKSDKPLTSLRFQDSWLPFADKYVGDNGLVLTDDDFEDNPDFLPFLKGNTK